MRKIDSCRIFFIATVIVALFSDVFPAPEDLSSWLYAQKIVLNTTPSGAKITENVYRFPVLVRLTPSNFSGFTSTLPQGADIRFTKANGAPLFYEIERWVDGTNNSDTADIWVRVDSVFGNNGSQYFMMYWGKSGVTSKSVAGSVFDTGNGFVAVYHLKENQDNAADATLNNLTAARIGTPARISGCIGYGQSFGGSGTYYKTGPFDKCNFGSVFTTSSWVFLPSSVASPGALWSKGNDNTVWEGQEMQFYLGNNTTDQAQQGRFPQMVGYTRDYINGSSALTPDVWHQVTYVYQQSDNTKLIYVDGQTVPLSNTSYLGGSDKVGDLLFIGRDLSFESANDFHGSMDEVVVSKNVRSANWIRLCYENQKAGQSLVSFIPVDVDNYTLWPYFQKIYINTSPGGANVPGTVTEFPLLVKLDPNRFKGFSQTYPGGVDVRFAKSNGAHLSYEIERWVDAPNNADTAEIWVRVDTLRGNNRQQFILMYWGKSSVTGWSNGNMVFDTAKGNQGVWHLNEGPVGANALKDRTYNNNHGTPQNGLTSDDLVNGVIGKGLNFDGPTAAGGDYVRLPNSVSLDNTGNMTMSCWFRMTNGNSTDYYGLTGRFKDSSLNFSGYKIDRAGDQHVRFIVGNGTGAPYLASDSVITGTAWHYATGVVTSGTMNLFLDGVRQTASASATPVASNGYGTIGRPSGNSDNHYFVGDLDEVRFMKKACSADWIKLSYENQKPLQKLVSFTSADDENYATWPSSQKIFINTSPTGANVAGTVTGFPLLVRLNPATFPGFPATQPGGADVRFASSDGTHLNFEIERWVDGSGNNDTAEIWVKVDTVRGNLATQYIRIYWGKSGVSSVDNGSEVFDIVGGFVSAYHMNESTGSALDATANGLNAAPRGALPDRKPGMIGYGENFNGGPTCYNAGNDPRFSMSTGATFTISAWVKRAGLNTPHSQFEGIAGRYVWAASQSREFYIGNDTGSTKGLHFTASSDGTALTETYVNSGVAPQAGTWHYAAGTMDGSTMRFYVDGVLKGSTSKTTVYGSRNADFRIGICDSMSGSYYQTWNGMIDEVALSRVSRNADWIKLSWETQRANTGYAIIPEHRAAPVIVNGTPVDRVVKEGTAVTMTVQAAGCGPLSYRWYRNTLLPADTVAAQNDSSLRFSTARLSDGATYFCIVSNPYGKDTSRAARLAVEPDLQVNNPITLRASFIDSTHVLLTINRYNSLPIAPTSTFRWVADSVWVWYKANDFPSLTWTGDPLLLKFPLAALRQDTSDRHDTIVTVAKYPAAGCYLYDFIGSVYWKNTSGGPDSISPFMDPSVSGASVYMCDTTPLANPVMMSFDYRQQTDTVLITLSKMTQLNWDLIASVDISYTVGTGTAVVTSLPATAFARSVDIFRRAFQDSRFNGEEKWVYWEVLPRGVYGNRSVAVRDSCRVGVPRPSNAVVLSVGNVASSRVGLYWSRPATLVDSVRIWYGVQQVPLQYDPPAGLFGVIMLASADTTCTVTGLTAEKTYYFGLQVRQAGLWSYITEASRVSVTTLPIQDTLPIENRLRLLSLAFDTAQNQVVMQWVVDTVGLELEAGVVWSHDSIGYPKPDPPGVGKVVSIADPATPMTYTIAVPATGLGFNADYFFAVWLRKVNGAWAAPVPASIMKLHIPAVTWERVVFFNTIDTVKAFNGQVVLRKATEEKLLVESLLRLLQLPVETSGCIPMSIAFSFDHQNAPPLPLHVGLQYSQLPPGYTAGDLRMYHYVNGNGTWIVDTLPASLDTTSRVYDVLIRASECTVYPFIVMIDTVMPVIRLRNDGTEAVPANEPITLSAMTRDNIANARIRLQGGRGEDPFTLTETMYADRTDDTVSLSIPGSIVSRESGVRLHLTVSDGRSDSTINASRDVVRPISDSVLPGWLQWRPIGSAAVLDNPTIGAVLKEHAGGNGELKYDNAAFRLFRWSTDKWEEYSNARSDAFNLEPTSVVWLKRRLTSPIFYGKGRTASLRTPYRFMVPARGWVDFCLPYRFNVRVGDVLTASGMKGGGTPLFFYEWRRNPGDLRLTYFADGIYLPQTPGKNDPNYELTSHNGTAYTVYNASDTPMEIALPGVPVPFSGTTLGKQASANGWSIAIRASSGQGAMAPAYCGYLKGGKERMTYPVPPSWNGVTVNVYDKSRGSVYGGMLIRELPDSGYTYEIVFDNATRVKETISYRLDRLYVPDNNTMIGIIDPETGAISPAEDSMVIEVDPHSRGYRWLVVGSVDYFTTLKQMPFRGEFRLLRTVPNPFKQSLRIHYQIPYGGIEWIRCEVFDPRGKQLWKLQVGPRLHPGENTIVWSPRKERPMAAGTYIIRLSGFDGRNRIIGNRTTRVTYLPF